MNAAPHDGLQLVRGDLPVTDPAPIRSPIANVPTDAWTRFVRAMMTQPADAVSPSNALGMFEMRPRRLADLGLMVDLQRVRAPNRRDVWCGVFVRPLSSAAFLRSPLLQYNAFALSMVDYARRIESGEIMVPDGVSLSGALAVLHRAGPHGLDEWGERQLPETRAAVERVNGVF